MSSAPERANSAAWLAGPKVSPLQIKEAPYPAAPRPNDLVVETAFVAINPLEYKVQDFNPPIGGNELSYPTIMGSDLAGKVVAVGSAISSFKVGDRVTANAVGLPTGNPSMSAFQRFVQLHESSVMKVPDSVTLESACVLPLACDTAMAGLFVEDAMALSTLQLGDNAATPPVHGSVVIVWGGSSSVGCCAIQLAHAAGYEVYTTASQRNHELCISIGASRVFDHSNHSVEHDIIDALKGKSIAGTIDCISDDKTTTIACARILAASEGSKKIMCVLSPGTKSFPGQVEAQRLSIPNLRKSNQYDIVHSWMERALADGSLKPKPDPKIIGEGLEYIQLGIDIVRKGVSATKIVVKL